MGITDGPVPVLCDGALFTVNGVGVVVLRAIEGNKQLLIKATSRLAEGTAKKDGEKTGRKRQEEDLYYRILKKMKKILCTFTPAVFMYTLYAEKCTF